MKVMIHTACLTMGLSLIASSAVAQEPAKHDGFWFGFGLGGGLSSEEVGTLDRRGGAAAFRAGGTVNQHVLFGGEVAVWFRDPESTQHNRVNVTATALVYPSSNGGAFLKGGFGVATVEQSGWERTGIGTTFGAGYDLRVGRNLYVTPSVDMLLQFFENSNNTALLFTLGFTWH